MINTWHLFQMKNYFNSLLTILLLVGCSTTTTTEVTVGATSMDIYNATLKTLVRNGFQVTHTDRASNIISASRPLKQALTSREDSKQARVSIFVDQSVQGSVLTVTWTPPEGALGSFEPEHDELLRGLSQALPGVGVQ